MNIIEARERFNLVGVSPATWDVLMTRGKEYKGIARPKYFRKRRDRDCFYNATMTGFRAERNPTWKGPKVTYVEGVAYDLNCFFHHAWVTTDDEHAIDVTWREPGTFYWGVAVPFKELCGVLARTGYYGSILEQLEQNERAAA